MCLARTRFSSNSSTGLQNVLVISKIVPSATVFTELLGRILDLDADDWGPTDNQMVITVFQYAAYFLTQGRLVVVKRIMFQRVIKLSAHAHCDRYGYNLKRILACF